MSAGCRPRRPTTIRPTIEAVRRLITRESSRIHWRIRPAARRPDLSKAGITAARTCSRKAKGGRILHGYAGFPAGRCTSSTSQQRPLMRHARVRTRTGPAGRSPPLEADVDVQCQGRPKAAPLHSNAEPAVPRGRAVVPTGAVFGRTAPLRAARAGSQVARRRRCLQSKCPIGMPWPCVYRQLDKGTKGVNDWYN